MVLEFRGDLAAEKCFGSESRHRWYEQIWLKIKAGAKQLRGFQGLEGESLSI